MKEYKMKIALLGGSGVGKTSILNRYMNNGFEENKSTINATFNMKVIDDPNGKFKIKQIIWDTAGQEIYRSLASFYYKDADAVLLVYDITNKSTFEDMNFWINEVNKKCQKNVLVSIVANKSDLLNMNEISLSDGIEFANSHGARFFSSSAKCNINIAEIFFDLSIRKFGNSDDNVFSQDAFKQDCLKSSEIRKDSIKLATNKINIKGKKKCCN